MELDDNVTISTPEGILLRLQLAGLGSRFIAGAVDLSIELILIVILSVIASSSSAGAAVAVIGSFLILFFYPVLFEVLRAGRTPGKSFSHLRVIRDSGAPVDLPASAIRNLLRLVDGLLLLYVPTIVSIAITPRNQRPGDLAAGTLVIREHPIEPTRAAEPGDRISPAERWDASAVSVHETAAVRRFLDRRGTLEPSARAQLARRLADGLRPKVSAAPPDLEPERFLEELARIKRSG